MVERTMSLGVGGNGETMRAQQKLLQKITRELDAEREASSTAASEALSMILRLQGEKAALEMEASQYKRLAEEKMCHAETSLTLFEDLIYRKEMEMASLEFQVQAYRCKLLSLGCSDQAEEKKKGDVESSSSLSPRKDLSACWEQIRMIDDRVREVSESRDVPKGSKWGLLRRESISHALVSQVSNTILESAKSDVSSIMEMLKNPDREVPRTKESLAFISEERNVGGKMASSKHELLKVTSIEAEYTSLLKEIREQISVMQSEMRGLRSELQQTRFVSHREECPALNSIQEAMLHFWL
ncbi:probable myosin-binding protein 6 [Raphanus sativus]|uniref:Probable myosin-binding protein 6 n=1 Tax=Raphanus sativus TaxID=3726 RepID=A0A6J0MWR2_RAPSA|nr:probable myosin-binding protein 6 [Raphanus sativus]